MLVDLRNMASNEMVITKVRLYGDDGVSLPWHWDTTTCEFVDVTADTNTYNVTTPNAASTAGFGGEKVQTIAYGNSLVYDFKVVESNLSVQDVNGDGNTSDNANVGYVGFGVDNNASVSNWPGKMIFTNGSYSGITNNSFGGTPDYSSSQHWWQLLQTGASVKVVYTRTSSASANDGTFVIYRKLEGEAEYTQWAAVRDLGDISGSGRINIMYENKGARVLKLTNLATYVLDPNGNKVSVVGALGTNNIAFIEDGPTYAGEDTVNNTYAIGYEEGTTKASGWFGNNSEINLVGDEVLTMEFEVLAAGNKWQNANSGFVVCDIDPNTQSTSPQNFSNIVGMYGNWAFSTSTYESRTARNLTSNGTVSGIWDPYTDVAAGDWVKVEYKAYTSDDSKGYLRVYTKSSADAEYTLNASIEDITNEIRNNVRLVWYVDSGSGGTNFTHTITNYRMYTSNGQFLTDTDSWGGNHAVEVTEG